MSCQLVNISEKVILELLFRYLPVNMFLLDRNGIILQCKKNAIKKFGIKSEGEVIGKHCTKVFMSQKAWEKSKEIMDNRRAEAEVSEETFHKKDGTDIYLLNIKSVVENQNKEVVGLISISLDISDRKNIENKLKIKEERAQNTLAAIIALLPAHVYWKDRNGVYLGCNDLQAQSLGLASASDIIGKTDYDLSSEKLANKYSKIDKKIMADRITAVAEEPANYHDKQAIFLSKKCPWIDASGNVIGVIGVSIDITDRKKAEELEAKNKAAEKAVEFANMIAGSVAHELRTPLAAINIQMDLAGMTISAKEMPSSKKNAAHKQIIAKVKNIIQGALHVIDDILLKLRSLSFGDLAKQSMKRLSIIDEVENLLESYPFRDNELSLIKFNSANGFKYFGNSNLTKHVLFNLLKNALRAIQEAEKGKITIALKDSDPDFNKLIFTDTALGISREFLPKIFEQFQSITKCDSGTGLGLAFCKKVMQVYGGDIVCDSRLGRYTKFILSFPKIR